MEETRKVRKLNFYNGKANWNWMEDWTVEDFLKYKKTHPDSILNFEQLRILFAKEKK